jgi:iron complex outermembrane recepter protein
MPPHTIIGNGVNTLMQSHTSLVLRAAIATVLMAATHVAKAADSSNASEQIAEVVVTGSYIRGTPVDAALPVTVVRSEDIEKQGSPSILDVIRSLSASQGTIGETNAQAVLEGGGGVSVNLRGLDAGRTLVLFNGRRLPVSPVPLLGVDVNLLPLSAVGRIEVLKDGAAATYGSDAVAGVVNFISNRGFDGLTVDASYTGIEDSDGDYSTGLTWGRKTDAFDVLVSAGYRHRSELKVTERDFAVPPYDPTAGLGGFSAAGNPGAFIIPPVGAVPNVFVDPGCSSLGGALVTTGFPPQCQFRFARFQNLVEREEDYGLYAELNTQLGDFAELHVEGFYTAHDIPEENASPSFPATKGPGATIQRQFGLPVDPVNAPTYLIPLNNPGLRALLPALSAAQQAGITAAGGVVGNGLLFRSIGVGGNPLFENEGIQRERFTDAMRFSVGLDGDLGNVGWDLALTYGENSRRVRTPLILASRLQLALAGFGGANCTGAVPGSTANGCYFLNPFSTGIASNVTTGQVNAPLGMGGTFDPATVNSREVVDYLFEPYGTDDTTSVFVADLVFDGDSGIELPGGNIAWALGAQFREDGMERELNDLTNLAITPCADSVVNPNATCSVATGPFDFQGGLNEVDVDSDVYGLFTELSLPLTQSLQAQVAFRYEDYGGTTGSTTNPKVAVRWQATDWLAVRGSAGSTFRGPILFQTLAPPITTLQFAPLFGAIRPFDNFGNPDLKPEKADAFNVGLVVAAGNLFASLDYFDIRLEDKVLNEMGPDVLTAFFGTVRAPENNCGRSGYEALQARFTFQNGVCSPQNLLRTRANAINAPDERIRGIDLSMSYRFENVLGGDVRTGLDGTYNLEYSRDAFFIEGVRVPTAGGRDFVGTRGGIQALPELRGSVFVEYSSSIHNVRVTGQYTDGVTDLQDAARDPNGNLDEVASYFTTDLVYQLALPEGLTLTGAVFNVADRDPPRAKLLDYNFDPLFYNPVGRAFKVALTKRF